jgi:hypothetical protein
MFLENITPICIVVKMEEKFPEGGIRFLLKLKVFRFMLIQV